MAFDVRRPPLVVAARQVIFVDIEAAVEAEAAVERKPRDKRRRVIAGLLEVLGRRSQCRREDVATVVPESMRRRRAARQNRRVRWAGQRNVRQRRLEPNAAFRERVEIRGHRVRVAVAAEVIGAQRVDRHEQDVRMRPSQQAPARTWAAGSRRSQDQDEH